MQPTVNRPPRALVSVKAQQRWHIEAGLPEFETPKREIELL